EIIAKLLRLCRIVIRSEGLISLIGDALISSRLPPLQIGQQFGCLGGILAHRGNGQALRARADFTEDRRYLKLSIPIEDMADLIPVTAGIRLDSMDGLSSARTDDLASQPIEDALDTAVSASTS